MEITLRPAEPGDGGFLLRVFESTREEELTLVSWGIARKRQFIESQFAAQDSYLRQEFSNASFQVVVCDGVPAGRLYVARSAEEIRILDLALLPEYRGRGIGGHLLAALCEEADVSGRRMVTHLELGKRARRLYERLGFEPMSDKDVQLLMQRRPVGAA